MKKNTANKISGQKTANTQASHQQKTAHTQATATQASQRFASSNQCFNTAAATVRPSPVMLGYDQQCLFAMLHRRMEDARRFQGHNWFISRRIPIVDAPGTYHVFSMWSSEMTAGFAAQVYSSTLVMPALYYDAEQPMPWWLAMVTGNWIWKQLNAINITGMNAFETLYLDECEEKYRTHI